MRSLRGMTGEQRDRYEEQAQEAYDEAFERIEAQMKAEAISEGMDEDYKPSGALVHQKVEAELRKRVEDAQ